MLGSLCRMCMCMCCPGVQATSRAMMMSTTPLMTHQKAWLGMPHRDCLALRHQSSLTSKHAHHLDNIQYSKHCVSIAHVILLPQLIKWVSIPCCREGEKLDLDAQRRVRTPEEMAEEAAQLRAAFDEQHGGASSF